MKYTGGQMAAGLFAKSCLESAAGASRSNQRKGNLNG